MAGKDNTRQYLALLRAVNVGGSGVIRMTDLKKLFETCGLTDVKTYIQTGNVLFKAEPGKLKELGRRVETAMEKTLGRPIPLFILTPAQLKKAADHNPLDPKLL